MPQSDFIDFKAWRAENQAKLKQSQAKFHEKHPDYQKKWRKNHPEKVRSYNKKANANKYWVGIDGEGKTCSVCGAHHYISLNWSDAAGTRKGEVVAEPWPVGMCCQEAENKGIRLTTEDCLNLILSIPKHARIAGYALGYDLTKWVEDLPDAAIFRLPRLPAGKKKARVRWITPSGKRFKLGMLSTEFYVTECDANWKDVKKRTVHDGFKFFGRTFVGALEDWDVGSKEERRYLQEMKDRRGNFEQESMTAIVDYSDLEVRRHAELMTKMVRAHDEGKIPLTMYYGAGSTAAAMLDAMKIRDYLPENNDYAQAYEGLEEAISMAFFGGRFEIARQGFVRKLVHDWDISSAYPYQIYSLPCLRCGKWSKTRDIDRVREADAALVRYELGRWKHGMPAWGPFPFREKEGTIPFPIESGGGWICRDEFFAGRRNWDNVEFREGWVYETPCQHHPFKNVPHWYLARLGIGKEGAGIVFKLGLNAIYGKLAQQIGSKKYHNLLWAAIITSGCRAQLLDLMACHERLEDILMVATDGLNGLANITPPLPSYTGTDIEVTERKTGKKIRKPLGGWEHNTFDEGMFLARPGIYFPITEDTTKHPRDCSCKTCEKVEKMFKDAKARGIGTRHLWKHRFHIMEHWEKHKEIKLPYTFYDNDQDGGNSRKCKHCADKSKGCPYHQALDRFVGLRTGITISNRRTDLYGRWYRKIQKLDFKPEPKRNYDAKGNLVLRKLDRTLTSTPYAKREEIEEVINEDDFVFDGSVLESLDQPDWDG